MEVTKNKLLEGAAPFTEPTIENKPKGPKGKSNVEIEIERKNQGTKPKVVGRELRGARADNADHDHSSRHGDRGGDQDDDVGDERKPKRYLRKKAVAKRYGGVNERTVPRIVADGRLPPPDLYNGRFPLWAEDTLDAHDRKAARKAAPYLNQGDDNND
jgi:hypothetical protein